MLYFLIGCWMADFHPTLLFWAGWMIRALKDQNRPEAVFTVHGGMILEGDDILMATMSLTAAKVRCTSLPNCCGFYSEDWPTENSGFIEGRSEAEQAGNGGGTGES